MCGQVVSRLCHNVGLQHIVDAPVHHQVSLSVQIWRDMATHIRLVGCYLGGDTATLGEKAVFKQVLRCLNIHPGCDDAPGPANIACDTGPADASLPEPVHGAPLPQGVPRGAPAVHHLGDVGAGCTLRACEIRPCVYDLTPVGVRP